MSWFTLRVLSRYLSEKIQEHPQVIGECLEEVRRQIEKGDYHCSPTHVKEWERLLQEGMPSVVRVLMSPDDGESQVLRSCLPSYFGKLISQEERLQLISQVKKELSTSR